MSIVAKKANPAEIDTPNTGKVSLYVDCNDGKIKIKDDCGCVNTLVYKEEFSSPAYIDFMIVGGGGNGGSGNCSYSCLGGGGGGGGIMQCYGYTLFNNNTCIVVGCAGGTSCFGDYWASGGVNGRMGRDEGGRGGAGGSIGCGTCTLLSGCPAATVSGISAASGGGTMYQCGEYGAYANSSGHSHGGYGGAGLYTNFSGERCCYGGGGGGGLEYNPGQGQFGGGSGGSYGGAGSHAGCPAITCGSGGGGTWCGNGGAGACGIVYVRYKEGGASGILCATGGTITCCNGYVIHTFTENGTFTITCSQPFNPMN